MGVPASDIDRIERELDEVRAERQARWEEQEVPLDPSDPESRTAWAKARESFFTDHGVVPIDRSARAKLRSMKDTYRGERIFVIGNGPSLNDTALHLLEDEFTFGVNRIYLLYDRTGWRPTFYTTLDWRVAPDCAPEINSLSGSHLFFPERFRGLLRDGEDVTWYWNDQARHPSERGFASDASLGIRGAGSVTGAAIQLAFHLGFDPIYLIGCDVSYSVPDTVIQEGPDKFGTGVGLYLTSTRDDDSNHFDKRYFGTGRRWHDPNVKRMIEGFTQCREGVERHNRTIKNATVGGKLEVFDRIDFRSLFTTADPRPPIPSLAAFATAALTPNKGLMVDIGAGQGGHLAPFGALGWEIRAFEPSPAHRNRLRSCVPADWELFLDARALDAIEGSRGSFVHSSVPGVSLVPLGPDSKPGPTVTTAHPSRALEPLNGRVPDVLAVDTNQHEAEVLRAWPFDDARPSWIIVSIDYSVSPPSGRDRESVLEILEAQGYSVFMVEGGKAHRLSESSNRDTAGAAVTLVGGPPEHEISQEILDTLTRAYTITLAQRSSHAIEGPGSRGTADRSSEQVEKLERELAMIRSSTSWKVGSGIVQTGARLTRALTAAVRTRTRKVRRTRL